MNSIFITLASLILLTGCGADQEQAQKDAEETAAMKIANDRSSLATIVDSDLPICDDTSLKALVYQRSTDQFFYCENTAWLPIELNGKDGAPGKDGANGKDAVAPVTTAGDDGAPGQDANAINTWNDPITGSSWLFGAISVTRTLVSTACSNGYRLPSSTEAIEAVLHGLLTVASDHFAATTMWVNDAPEQPSPNDYWFYVDGTATRHTQSAPNLYGIICLKEEQ